MTDKERLDAQKHAIQLIAYFLGKSDVNFTAYGHSPFYYRNKNADRLSWIVLNEANSDVMPGSYQLVPLETHPLR